MVSGEHEWTGFEMYTLLCLMARGVHLPSVKRKRNQDEDEARQQAHINVATDLNIALNGKSYFGNDITKREVSMMIDRILSKKKGIMGPGGYMERSSFPRITRGLKRAFERHTKLDFNGGESEWKLWRKGEEAEKNWIKEGGAPCLEGAEFEAVVEKAQYRDQNGDERGNSEELQNAKHAGRRLTAEETRQDYLSGGYDRTPRRVEQPATTDLDTNIWAQADITTTTSQSQAQWGRTTPPYVPSSRLYASAEHEEAEEARGLYRTFDSGPGQSNASLELPLQYNHTLPTKPQVCYSATPSLSYTSSSPQKPSSETIHSLPGKPVSILKSSKRKTQDHSGGK